MLHEVFWILCSSLGTINKTLRKEIEMNFIKELVVLNCFFALCVSGFLFLTGCSETESENVRTRGIHADIDVYATGNGNTSVSAKLTVGSGLGGTDLELTGGEQLTATANGNTQTLSKSSSLIDVEYKTTFDFDIPETEFIVSYIREDGADAENSVVVIPFAMNILAPEDGSHISTDDTITFRWEPYDLEDEIKLSIIFDCCETQSCNTDTYFTESKTNFNDTGEVSFTVMGLFGSQNPEDYVGGCELNVALIRSRPGEIDPNYGEGGNITAKQSREITLYFEP